MVTSELEQIVAGIGEAFLARLGSGAASGGCGGGGGKTCGSCCGSNAHSCVHSTREIVAAGADRVSSCHGVRKLEPSIAKLIDHTLLKPDATRDDIRKLCAEARTYGFASVCLNSYWVPLAAKELAGTGVKVCTVAGFPLGACATGVKVTEADQAVRDGAQEVDMVINVGALRSGDLNAVKDDIQAVAEACHRHGAILKVILETALLDNMQKAVACTLAKMANADFVKTSTGFGPAGATAEDVALMRKVVGPEMGVKAAGGIRTLEDLKKMTAAGATRIGASASVKIVEAAGA